MTVEATTSSAIGFRHFHDQLSSLKEQLLGMSAKAEERTDLAMEALLARDTDKANLVIEGDVDLNKLEIEVEQAAVELLALQQPMARDLRFIIGAIKVSNDLERVGDHAVNIAESAIRLAEKPKVSIKIPEIEVMARRARKGAAVAFQFSEDAVTPFAVQPVDLFAEVGLVVHGFLHSE